MGKQLTLQELIDIMELEQEGDVVSMSEAEIQEIKDFNNEQNKKKAI